MRASRRERDKAILAAEAESKFYYHLFLWAVYFMPFLGALISDGLLGKYRTIIWLSLVYCAGHVALAADEASSFVSFAPFETS